MQHPLITVIIPTYNYAHYITTAIESVFQQDYPADQMEIVIVDDGSSDNTQEVVEQLKDQRIRFYYQQNAGKAAATAKAIDLAEGKYIFNLDADDYFLPNKIRKTVEIFEKHPKVVHVASPAKMVWENEEREKVEPIPNWMLDKVLVGEELNTFFMQNNMLYGGGSTYAARASAIKQVKITPDINIYIDEYLIVALLPFGDAYFFSNPLSVWRIHGKNYSGKRKTKADKIKRDQQLLASSLGTLQQLRLQKQMPQKIFRLYEFKHQMRIISAKEKAETKSIKDIFQFLIYSFFQNRQPLSVLKKYNVFNRLVPQFLIKLLK